MVSEMNRLKNQQKTPQQKLPIQFNAPSASPINMQTQHSINPYLIQSYFINNKIR